jgi:hypothetical protein
LKESLRVACESPDAPRCTVRLRYQGQTLGIGSRQQTSDGGSG